MIFLVLAIFCAALCWWGFSSVDYEAAAVLGSLGGMFVILAAIAALVNWWSFEPAMTRMAQTRQAIQQLPCTATFSGSQIYGQALEWNQEAQSNRLWNKRWIAEPFVPDGWDTVSLIVLPNCQ